MSLSLWLCVLAANLPAATTNAPSDAAKKAVDLLRETIYQYERRRGTILPPPTLTTNPVARPGTNAPSAPVTTVPSNPPPTVAPGAQPAGTNGPISSAPASAATARATSLVELERLYLDGKITARQFQKYLQQYEQTGARVEEPPPTTPAPLTPAPSPRAPAPVASIPAPATARPPAATGAPSRTNTPSRRAPTPTPAPAVAVRQHPDQAALSEVEKKMDELIKAKAARDATNAAHTATNAAAAGPKTQRQRLDELLRLYIEGKVSEAEYKERREKIIAEKTK